LLVEVQLNFRDAAAGFNEQRREYRVFYPLEDELPLAPLILPLEETDLLPLPQNQLVEPLPHWLDEEEELLALSRRVCEEIHSMESSGVWINPVLKLNSKAGESEAVFKERVTAKIEGQIETAIAGLYKELKKQIDSLESRLKSLTAQKEKLERDHSSQQTRELLNAGETMLAWFTGRSRSFNRLTRIVDHREKVGEAARKVEEVEAELVTIRAQLYELESELERKVAAIRAELEAAADQSVHREILLEPGDVRCLRSGVLWIPAHNRKL
jgi:chaperonin cofactor prefoldin